MDGLETLVTFSFPSMSIYSIISVHWQNVCVGKVFDKGPLIHKRLPFDNLAIFLLLVKFWLSQYFIGFMIVTLALNNDIFTQTPTEFKCKSIYLCRAIYSIVMGNYLDTNWWNYLAEMTVILLATVFVQNSFYYKALLGICQRKITPITERLQSVWSLWSANLYKEQFFVNLIL